MKYITVVFSTLIVAFAFHTSVYSQTIRFDSVTIQFNGIQINQFENEHSVQSGDVNWSSKYFIGGHWTNYIKTDSTNNDTSIFISNTESNRGLKFYNDTRLLIIFQTGMRLIDSFSYSYTYGYTYNGYGVKRELNIRFIKAPITEDEKILQILLDSIKIIDSKFYYNDNTEYRWLSNYGEYNTHILDTNCSVVVTFYKHDPNAYTKQPPKTSGNYFIFPSIVSSSLNIHLKNPDGNKLIITDLLGREMLNRPIGEGEEDISLNVASLLKGVYWARVGSRVQKFIVQH